MEHSDVKYSQYLQILREELLPAMGCTEPIAMAYAAAKARQTLGELPDKIDIVISGNIIKNVKSVVVPNTGGLKGIAAAIAAGAVRRRGQAARGALAGKARGYTEDIRIHAKLPDDRHEVRQRQAS